MIITITSFKGGVGKSTTAIHLAAYLANKRNKTVLADGDLNRSVINWFERGGENLPFSVCDGDSLPDRYDHLVIDTAARPTNEELVALAETSDLLVVPCTPTTFSLEATIGTLAVLPSDRYKILLTVVPPKPSREGEKALSALKKAGLPVFNTMIRRFTVYLKAENLGVPVSDVRDPKSAEAWADYTAVGKEIVKVVKK
ncbi:AAA family ATPase [Pantanalinema rosaneae CENA516]|uniref:nucleotide-binding protein n=1 Tax=Pantanalinema rosaneae TaxID=1620701 RepID=UPI003D6F89E6